MSFTVSMQWERQLLQFPLRQLASFRHPLLSRVVTPLFYIVLWMHGILRILGSTVLRAPLFV